MKHRSIILAVVMTLLTVSAVAQYVSIFDFPQRGGVERVTHYDPRVNYERIDSTVYLEPYQFDKGEGVGRGGYSPIYPRGTARVRSSTYYGYPRGSFQLSIKDIPASERVGGLYEAWLVDEDSGYRLSMGTFTASLGGVGTLNHNMLNYLNEYDTVEITFEPYDDLDPLPGPIVLIGVLPKSHDFYNPEPKQAKLITESINTY